MDRKVTRHSRNRGRKAGEGPADGRGLPAPILLLYENGFGVWLALSGIPGTRTAVGQQGEQAEHGQQKDYRYIMIMSLSRHELSDEPAITVTIKHAWRNFSISNEKIGLSTICLPSGLPGV